MFCSTTWKDNPEGFDGNLNTFSVKEVTKIDVFTDSSKGFVVALVFYKDQTIIGAPVATDCCNYTIDSIKANFIVKCPGNKYTRTSYKKPKG